MLRDSARAIVLPIVLFGGGAPLAPLDPPGFELPLQRSRSGLPVVVVESAGVELRFALDTGTSLSLVGAEAAERLRLVPRARFSLASVAGQPQSALCGTPPRLVLAGVDIAIDCLGWVPHERRLAGVEDVDGLLGADALSRVDIWIDRRRGRARVAPPGTLLAWIDGVPIRLELVRRRPVVQVDLAVSRPSELPARMVVDSGADVAVLFGDLARRGVIATSAGGSHSGLVRGATARRRALVVPLGGVRIGATLDLDGGPAALLPNVGDRVEDGLLPIDWLGPVLLDLSGGVMVARATLRDTPRTEHASVVSRAPATVAAGSAEAQRRASP